MSEELPSGSPADPSQQGADAPRSPRRLAKTFRWQALFQRCAEPIFVLDRRRRLLFVNRAWEKLTGMTAVQAHILAGRRPRPVAVGDSTEEVLAHVLTPPPEVLQGAGGHVRRLLPGGPARRWWDVEFLPLRQEGEQGGYLILGRIRPIAAVEPTGETPLPEKLVNLRQERVERYSLDAWASSLPAVRRLVEQVRLAEQVTVPVLLVGEAGTGKQTLARTIHYRSPRRDGACAALDCERLPSEAVAAFLFGERAAGRAGVAAVYLREPACLPRDVQLRLAESIARRSAAGAEDKTVPRIFAGCTVAPGQAVRAGRLLDVLAGALGTLVLEVPPLRERQADLPDLVERLLERASAGRDVGVTSLSADAWTLVRGYTWPGNVRELDAILRTACSRAGSGSLRAADLPAELRRAVEREQTPPRPVERALPLEQLLEEAERRLILLALRRTRGHKARAARLLSIPRPRLWRRMVKLGIVDTEEDAGSPAEETGDEE
jgi:transcriptional regulator with PAS, ATPase and Fis domain